MTQSVEKAVMRILAEQAFIDIADVSLDQSLVDLGIDSMGLVESIFAMEEAFDIAIPFNANAPEASSFDISSVATIVAVVKSLIAQKQDA
ncbi:MAG: acyl carrier protein [Paracoccaceae bacterium]|jgi:acyl carrier protein|nr:MAG: phosphopantetheine-binding protein [Rhodobacter sp. BACL10 MAG-120910-bin24]KRO87977.1 MAG: phosphopantetheine-binding protein [Rhodobacter sp. BACL10 MAG-121220-bin24]MDO7560098.1 acyl carrier protein [Paracoccaceae bacterium]MDO7634015.1 acyl carrier protein [Paracoccaceae bacterium]MDO7659106.1 acyl carrier protein [Paracoccaceae bacterium]|tara:strand:+ start:19 stop:288 length:270 start_codon:yes stop_codon:yes gene_type:complete